MSAMIGAIMFSFGAAQAIATDSFTSSAQQLVAHQRAIDEARAPIKSQEDLIGYLANESSSSPLNRLSPDGKSQFIASIVFSDAGLASYDYAVLQRELTVSQIYDVLSLFGQQSTTQLIRGAAVESRADLLIAQPTAVNQPPNCGGQVGDDPRCRPEPGGGGGGGDHDNYRCAGANAHTCIKDSGSICTHNC